MGTSFEASAVNLSACTNGVAGRCGPYPHPRAISLARAAPRASTHLGVGDALDVHQLLLRGVRDLRGRARACQADTNVELPRAATPARARPRARPATPPNAAHPVTSQRQRDTHAAARPRRPRAAKRPPAENSRPTRTRARGTHTLDRVVPRLLELLHIRRIHAARLQARHEHRAARLRLTRRVFRLHCCVCHLEPE